MEDGAIVTMEESRNSWCGFKLVGDNIDKNVHPTYQRSDHQTQSLHYFHAYAVVDCIDLCELPHSTPERPDIDPSTRLPTTSDSYEVMQKSLCQGVDSSLLS